MKINKIEDIILILNALDSHILRSVKFSLEEKDKQTKEIFSNKVKECKVLKAQILTRNRRGE